MVCHLLPSFVYQPSLTAISIVILEDSKRSPVSRSIAQAIQLKSFTFIDLVIFLGLRSSQTVSEYSISFSPKSSISKRKAEKRPLLLIPAIMNCEDQEGRPFTR